MYRGGQYVVIDMLELVAAIKTTAVDGTAWEEGIVVATTALTTYLE